ncbi:MAG: transposase, partial [Tissierellia bacterium]|nr:transposase [Tissierellia bacterium]
PYLNGKLKCFLPKTEVLVIKAFNNDLVVAIDDNVYELKELSRNERFSKEFDSIPEIIKEKKKYVPPMSHPWKTASFKRQIEKAHIEHIYA